jgi:hypothetical protein
MFAARTSFYGINVITDNLTFYVDAGDKNSYPGSGTAWDDLTTNNFDLTLQNGPTFDSGNGGSIVFDGTNDNAYRAASLNPGNLFTVCAWVYPDAIGTTRRAVVQTSYPYSTGQGWLFAIGVGSASNAVWMSCGADNQYRISSANTMNTTSWQFICATRNGNTGGDIKLYRNGAEVTYSAAAGTLGGITYTNLNTYVGYRQGATTDPYDGKIAQVMVYNTNLTSDQILNNFNATRGRYGV